MSGIQLHVIVWQEGKHYVSQCLNVDVSSFGDTKQEAMTNLDEALALYFEDHDTSTLGIVENPEVVPVSLDNA